MNENTKKKLYSYVIGAFLNSFFFDSCWDLVYEIFFDEKEENFISRLFLKAHIKDHRTKQKWWKWKLKDWKF